MENECKKTEVASKKELSLVQEKLQQAVAESHETTGKLEVVTAQAAESAKALEESKKGM